ncbi:MAG: thiamine phosphate synthase [Gammaproteobacteria bacterium]
MQNLKGLYVIADAECIGRDSFLNKTKEVLTAGVKIIQYRDKVSSQEGRYKIAKELRTLTYDHECLLLINDDAQLAQSVEADGVHLGKNDGSIKQARELLGDNMIIGASCYAQIEYARAAVNA